MVLSNRVFGRKVVPVGYTGCPYWTTSCYKEYGSERIPPTSQVTMWLTTINQDEALKNWFEQSSLHWTVSVWFDLIWRLTSPLTSLFSNSSLHISNQWEVCSQNKKKKVFYCNISESGLSLAEVHQHHSSKKLICGAFNPLAASN